MASPLCPYTSFGEWGPPLALRRVLVNGDHHLHFGERAAPLCTFLDGPPLYTLVSFGEWFPPLHSSGCARLFALW